MEKFSAKREVSLEADLDLLLGALCIHWGFCNRLSAEDLLSCGNKLTAHNFADRVLIAEGMEPSAEPEYQSAIQRAFIERYGSAEVSLGGYSNSTMT